MKYKVRKELWTKSWDWEWEAENANGEQDKKQ